MERNNELGVRDHLLALEREEPWMEELAMMIIEFTGCDTAIAAGRAVDLCEDRRFGRAVSAMTQGFLLICRELENDKCMSGNQKETMRQLTKGMLERLMPLFPERTL